MPFVVTRANVPISHDQECELKTRFGRAIAHVPGKSEAGLLPAFLVESGSRSVLIRGVADYDTLMRAVASVAAI